MFFERQNRKIFHQKLKHTKLTVWFRLCRVRVTPQFKREEYMAGHSKWANIQHRKGVQDAKKGKLFTKLIREIAVAARSGGPDPKNNARLRDAILEANDNNMQKDTIERAIKRGSGLGAEDEKLEEVRYEGYGPSGIAFVVDCLTSNRKRTVSEVRLVFNNFGGNLGTDGSVSYLFAKKGILIFPPGTNETLLTEAAIEAGAEDILVQDDQSIELITAPGDFSSVRTFLSDRGFQATHAVLTEIPSSLIPITGEVASQIEEMKSELEALEDVQKVYTNASKC